MEGKMKEEKKVEEPEEKKEKKPEEPEEKKADEKEKAEAEQQQEAEEKAEEKKKVVEPEEPEEPEESEDKKEGEESEAMKSEEAKQFMTNFQKYMKDPKYKEQMKKLKEMAPLYEKHKFWDTQPVPHLSEESKVHKEGEIEEKKVKDVRSTPFPLPTEFEWVSIDLSNDVQMNEVFELLRDNYVEDSDNMFRFKYSVPFLRWSLDVPGGIKDWIVGVRVIKNKKLVGFISGIPVNVVVNDKKFAMSEINFLCVHKKLRAKRVAPVLIKEVTRRINLKNVWQAIYTAGKYLPTPFSEALYYHRSLNVKKLLDIGFCGMPPKSNLKRQQRLYKLPTETVTPNMRKMVKKDSAQIQVLLESFLKKFQIYPVFTPREVKHFLMPRDNVIQTYVVEEEVPGKGHVITDFISFYTLPSSVLKHESVKEMKAAYAYYYAYTKTPLNRLMKDALILASKSEHDVFNCLDIMDNGTVTDDLLFGPGNGNLMFYLYNYAISTMKPAMLGMVLV